MSKNDPTELMVALHHTSERTGAVLVSIDGEHANTKWIHKHWIESCDLTGKTTNGTNRGGQKAILPLATLVIPEWLALREGLI
jgi:hypothetical protein